MEQVGYTPCDLISVAPAATESSNTASLRDSVVLKRLLDEVRCETLPTASAATAYNRQHNRHNR
jgi:hypothetical protein